MSGHGSTTGQHGDASADALQSAVRLLMAGKLAEAVTALKKIVARDPNHAEALHMLGLLACKSGDFGSGVTLLSRSVSLNPEDAGSLYNLGNAYKGTQEFDKAGESFQRSLGLDPGNSQTAEALADILVKLRRMKEALSYYERAVDSDPNNMAASNRLAILYEQHNQADKARALAENALTRDPDNASLNLVLARCENRSGETRSAIIRLEHILEINLYVADDFRFYFELGRLYDHDNDPERAFRNFSRANSIQLERWRETRGDGPIRSDTIDIDLATFTAEWVARWSEPPPPEPGPAPVFLIGFPGSGTTLLDQILDAHPDIRVLEQKPMVNAVDEWIIESTTGYPSGLVDLSAQQIGTLRNIYMDSARRLVDGNGTTRIVDKLPLNTIKAGLIHRVFPNAKFIFALRHPHDVILSCFMQEFDINTAMAHFLDLESAANYYVKVMSIWNRFLELLPLDVQFIRYEALVEDLERETGAMLDFLSVPFDDRVLACADHARTGGRITTSGCRQVSGPIYKTSVARWRRYREYLEPVLPRLQPFVQQFGYE